MSKFFLTFRALDDLQDIYDYSELEWGESTASKYIQAFEDSFSLLRKNAGVLRINRQISSKLYIYNVRNHYLICDIIESDIYVLTIKHVSMNLLELLKELEPTLDDEVKAFQEMLRSKKQN